MIEYAEVGYAKIEFEKHNRETDKSRFEGTIKPDSPKNLFLEVSRHEYLIADKINSVKNPIELILTKFHFHIEILW